MQQPAARNPTLWMTSRSAPVQLLIVGALYYVSAEFGLRLSVVADSVTPLWPPTGVALVAMLVLGRRVWPAVAVAAFAVNLPLAPDALTALLIAVGNTIATLVAATLLCKIGFDLALAREGRVRVGVRRSASQHVHQRDRRDVRPVVVGCSLRFEAARNAGRCGGRGTRWASWLWPRSCW